MTPVFDWLRMTDSGVSSGAARSMNMRTTVLGLFDEVEDARRVLNQLVGSPLDLSTVQVVHADAGVQRELSSDAGLPTKQTVLTGLAAGAIFGAAAGAIASQQLELLQSLGTLLTLAAGLLAGAGIGAVGGALAGRLNLPPDQDQAIVSAIEEGCTALVVRTDNAPTARAIRDLFAAGGSRLVGGAASIASSADIPSDPSAVPSPEAETDSSFPEPDQPTEDSPFVPPWRRGSSSD